MNRFLSFKHVEQLKYMAMKNPLRHRMRSQCGRTLCALYAALACSCVLVSLLQDDGSKGRFVFMQLAVLPQVLLSYRIGADSWLSRLQPVVCMVLLFIAGLVALYGTGSVIGRLANALVNASPWLRTRRDPRTFLSTEYNARRPASNLGE
jgi:hypothetical protein